MIISSLFHFRFISRTKEFKRVIRKGQGHKGIIYIHDAKEPRTKYYILHYYSLDFSQASIVV